MNNDFKIGDRICTSSNFGTLSNQKGRVLGLSPVSSHVYVKLDDMANIFIFNRGYLEKLDNKKIKQNNHRLTTIFT